jgi:8-oxo-dGTP pyrophosphatase MutT (NUDIX family)
VSPEKYLFPFLHVSSLVRKDREQSMAVQPRLSAGIMLLRDSKSESEGIEVFMVRRVAQSEFMPDVYVFPGGSVAPTDRLTEQDDGICRPVTPSPADVKGQTALGHGVRAAAIRELFEEANVLLAYHDDRVLALNQRNAERFAGYRQALYEQRISLLEMARAEQLVLATNLLVYFAHWITPEAAPKRFDTHFFLAHAPTEQEAIYDRLETSAGVWIQPAVALERFKQGSFPIAFPTFHQLRELAAFASTHAALETAAQRPVHSRMPIITREQGRTSVYLPEDPEHSWQL